jgi:hypothetical protein
MDLDAGKIWFSLNDTFQASGDPAAGTNEAFSGLSGQYTPSVITGSSADDYTINCGQSAFAGTQPSGFKRLCTANLAAPTIKDPSKHFQVDTFTGTGAELVRTLTDAGGSAVKPDMVWIKDRDSTVEHAVTDSARGATKEYNWDDNGAETTVAQGLKSFDTSGYTLGTDASYNASSSANVAWCWVTEGGSGSSNTDGSINTGTTTVNQTAGFSLGTFTGTGAVATVGHGLGAVPEFMISRHLGGGTTALAYHVGTDPSIPQNKFMNTDNTDSVGDVTAHWNDTAPTSSVMTLGASSNTNVSGASYLLLCWTGIEGYSKFGYYEGNGNADGTFVWCGFRPAWVLCKSLDSYTSWYIYDHKRDGYNVDNDAILGDTDGAELTADNIDILSNGFKLRIATVPNVSETYLFCAFAEFPFGGSGVSQARARDGA